MGRANEGAVVKKIKKAATDAGATLKLVAPKVGGAKLGDGSMPTMPATMAHSSPRPGPANDDQNKSGQTLANHI